MRFFVVIVACLFVTSCKPEAPAVTTAVPADAVQSAEPSRPGDSGAVQNPVKHEMQLLSVAMHKSLDAIANDELAVIPAEIAKVHPAKVATEEAVKAGTYKPPHNSERMDEFAKLDSQFHNKLRTLLGAAKNNDRPAAAQAYGELVQGCVTCHQTFRYDGGGAAAPSDSETTPR